MNEDTQQEPNLLSKIDSYISYKYQNINYSIKLVPPDKPNGINICSILAVPRVHIMNPQIILESNNKERSSHKELLPQALERLRYIAQITSSIPCPILIPILPSMEGRPYFQQLSRECFELDKSDPYYRIDEQVVMSIEKAKEMLKEDFGVHAEDKIFLNGYSSSGVFAQRFALIHPEIVEEACIGGASGSIPIPSEKIGYPIGIKDYCQLFNKGFNMEDYSNIIFKYYVGELETSRTTSERFDEDGNEAPMHDMSYFDRSVPPEVGVLQRKLFGRDMFERQAKTIDKVKSLGIDILSTIFAGRAHNDNEGHGVNELADKFINYAYMELYKNKYPTIAHLLKVKGKLQQKIEEKSKKKRQDKRDSTDYDI